MTLRALLLPIVLLQFTPSVFFVLLGTLVGGISAAALRQNHDSNSGAVSDVIARRGTTTMGACTRLGEDGVRWDVVRTDLVHVVQLVFEGALSRDLHASKDTKGRDPAVSYGDVQLSRHLERLQKLSARLEKDRAAEALDERLYCVVGRRCVRLFISVLFSGLPWPYWFSRYAGDLAGVVHGTNWTEALEGGWPILEIMSLIADLHGEIEAPEECANVDFAPIVSLIADGKQIQAGDRGRLSSCSFGEAVELLASATSGLPWTSVLGHLSRSQVAVRRAVGDALATPQTPLLAAPLPNLLLRLATKVQKARRKLLSTSGIDIIYCGSLEIDEAELRDLCGKRSACEVHTLETESLAESMAVCYAFYRRVVEIIRARGEPPNGSHASTLIISPLTWQWYAESTDDLTRLIEDHSRWREEIDWAGLPCLNSSRIWNWPVQRLRHQYWKLVYGDYATGHETPPYIPLAQIWAAGDTTSATRIYNTRALLELASMIEDHERQYPQMLPEVDEPLGPADATEWFIAMDIAAKARSLPAYTLLVGTALENSYRSRATLSQRLARTFHVEAARFLPGAPWQWNCLFPTSKTAAAFAGDYGVVVDLCTRERLRKMFQIVGRWWLGLNPRGHIIVPVSASVLNLYRSGDMDLFPWDADIDANFIASHPVVLGSFAEEHREHLATLGYDYILRGDRLVFKDLADSVRMDIWISGPQDVVQYDIRARLCGVRVNFFRQQLEGTVFYYRPGEKIFGNTQGMLLHCIWEGHNACLPDCIRGGLGVGSDGCEFPDRFVHFE
eukprot:TRINITY_DN73578_c0_g1_i1.p1 TRINITY_DN73578_c0_g1~~TRINITY_DN73578_c0_g1_i1.p1  ORF type:complete len:787 (+),score=111.14 TRINITY_DN73578_c0_g1_i1:82-2442(+)